MKKLQWLTKAEIKARFESGRGVSRFGSYQPWIRIQEISSDGTSYRALSHKTGRVVHLLSKLEFLSFSLFDWDQSFCDIREQYPFDLDISLEVAEKAGIKHPQKGNKFHVFTTDLLLDKDRFESKQTAVQVKYVKDLMDKNVVAKLEIERRCCLAKGIEWKLITELDIPRIQQSNVDWIMGGKNLHIQQDFEASVFSVWNYIKQAPDISLARVCSEYDRRYAQASGEALRLMRNAFAYRLLTFDIRQPYTKLKCQDIIALPKLSNSGGLYVVGQ